MFVSNFTFFLLYFYCFSDLSVSFVHTMLKMNTRNSVEEVTSRLRKSKDVCLWFIKNVYFLSWCAFCYLCKLGRISVHILCVDYRFFIFFCIWKNIRIGGNIWFFIEWSISGYSEHDFRHISVCQSKLTVSITCNIDKWCQNIQKTIYIKQYNVYILCEVFVMLYYLHTHSFVWIQLFCFRILCDTGISSL